MDQLIEEGELDSLIECLSFYDENMRLVVFVDEVTPKVAQFCNTYFKKVRKSIRS